jgi:acetyltransferase-like isoleucine patch superfamily enzyme
VEVGDLTVLGTGAVALPGVKIGDHAVVGAGAVVAENLEGNATYVGIPAREMGSET